MKNSSHFSTALPTNLAPALVAELQRTFVIASAAQGGDATVITGEFSGPRWAAVVLILGDRDVGPYWVVERIDFEATERLDAADRIRRAKAVLRRWMEKYQASRVVGGLC